MNILKTEDVFRESENRMNYGHTYASFTHESQTHVDGCVSIAGPTFSKKWQLIAQRTGRES